jgi:hypothetical protein
VPFKEKLDYYLNRQARKVREAGVDIRLGTVVTPEYAVSAGVNVVVAALGARPVKPPIPGIDGGNVLAAERTRTCIRKRSAARPSYSGPASSALSWPSTCRCRQKSLRRGDARRDQPRRQFPACTGAEVEIKKYGIDMNYNTKALEITDKGVVGEGPGVIKAVRGGHCHLRGRAGPVQARRQD